VETTLFLSKRQATGLFTAIREVSAERVGEKIHLTITLESPDGDREACWVVIDEKGA
jgi:hypothetical protein